VWAGSLLVEDKGEGMSLPQFLQSLREKVFIR